MKILIIDDNTTHSKILMEEIYKIGSPNYDFVIISDGIKAFDILQNDYSYDLIFIDIKLHGIDGLQIAKYIKREPDSKNTFVIVFSSSVSEEDIHKAKEIGVDGYISKPSQKSEEVFEEIRRLVKGVKKGKIKSQRGFKIYG